MLNLDNFILRKVRGICQTITTVCFRIKKRMFRIKSIHRIEHLLYNTRHRRKKAMATVFDVAKYILHEKGKTSTWKLQKLCYYAQAWHYTWTDEALFNQEIQAWANGPVCPALFNAHRGLYVVSEKDIETGDRANLTDEQKASVDEILDHYGDWKPYELREQTHAEKPWIKARNGIPEGERGSNPISLDSMGKYYGSL